MSAVILSEGQRFGKLVVRSLAGRNKHQCLMWTCDCDCGRTTVVVGSSLRSGTSKSCGCGMVASRYQTKEQNRNWKGEHASDKAARDRAVRWFRPTACSVEGCTAKAERHHIDENPHNNSPENIQFLCHPHHMRAHLLGKPKSAAMRAAISKTLRGRSLSPEQRAAVSAGLRRWWAERRSL